MSDVYKARGPLLKRCLMSPVTGFLSPVIVSSWVVAFVGLSAGGWKAAVSGAYLLVFVIRSAMMKLEADSEGVVITNRFMRHRIPWSNIRTIKSVGLIRSGWIASVVIGKRKPGWLELAAYGTLGLTKEKRDQVARDLASLAKQHGFGGVIAGSEREVAKQQADLDGWTTTPAPATPGLGENETQGF